jgi:hypothetical protein
MQANAPRGGPPEVGQAQASENDLARRKFEQNQSQQDDRQQNQGQQAGKGSTAEGQGDTGAPVWPLFVLLPVLLVAAVPISKRVLLARGRPEDQYRDLTGRLRDVLAPGRIADSPALTPTERVLLLAGAAGGVVGPMARFASAYSDHLYSSGRGGDGVASAYRDALRAYEALPRWRRTLGAANPSSLYIRLRKDLSARRARLDKALRGGLRRALRKRR